MSTQCVRVIRIDLEDNTAEGCNAPYTLEVLGREGYRHVSTLLSSDGRWAVVTLAREEE